MNPPVIRIKKGSVIYDDTKAQEASAPFRPNLKSVPSRRQFHRRRVGPRASLLPLLVIAAAIFVLFRVLPRAQTSRAALEGWQAALRVTPYEGTLIVGVTFVSRSGRVPGQPPEASVRFALVPGTEPVLVSGPLERSPITLTGRFPAPGSAGRVTAQVTILGSSVTLSAPVPRRSD